MTNRQKLKKMLLDVLLLSDDEFSFDLRRESVDTWDSLGVVAVATGIQEEFGYHLSVEEATSIASVPDIMRLLGAHSISWDD